MTAEDILRRLDALREHVATRDNPHSEKDLLLIDMDRIEVKALEAILDQIGKAESEV